MPKSKAMMMAEKRRRDRDHLAKARARQAAISGREDLPTDPLGIAYGHDLITESQYNAGRVFCEVYCTVFNKPFPACVSAEIQARGHHGEETGRDRVCKETLDKMTELLKGFSRSVYDVVVNACVYERPLRPGDLDKLRDGLSLIENVNTYALAA